MSVLAGHLAHNWCLINICRPELNFKGLRDQNFHNKIVLECEETKPRFSTQTMSEKLHLRWGLLLFIVVLLCFVGKHQLDTHTLYFSKEVTLRFRGGFLQEPAERPLCPACLCGHPVSSVLSLSSREIARPSSP